MSPPSSISPSLSSTSLDTESMHSGEFSSPSNLRIANTTAQALEILAKSLKVTTSSSSKTSPAITTDTDLIFKYDTQINAIITLGKATFEQINELAEQLVESLEEGDLQTQAFNHFPGLCDLLNTESPSFEVANIMNLLANFTKLKPALKEELTNNLSGVIALLQAGFSFLFILTRSPALRQYVLKHAPQIAILRKAGIPLHYLLELEKPIRQEVLEHAREISALKKNGVLLQQLLELKKPERQEILQNYSQVITLLSDNIPFESILDLFPRNILDKIIPARRKAIELFRKQVFENPAATILSLEKPESAGCRKKMKHIRSPL